ncbi:methyl-accepting chemotaxis protein [Algicola sagamiensis]|uniref:methyl-accepting chemotaxis protein n=1 Tax=Algicola sagamiensis TaxID=163869 RepID=UPI00035E0AD9|nr:methyl-accepting chemotaxis protein [Algicola sagamiensis]
MSLKLRVALALALSVLVALITNSVINTILSSKAMDESLLSDSKNKLIASKELVRARVEGYFSRIEGQIISLANNIATKQAMNDFHRAFEFYEDERFLDLEQARNSVQKYYQEEFTRQYSTMNADKPNIATMMNNLSETTLMFQYDFISNNQHPLGNKDKLYQLEAPSEYGITHALYHDTFRLFLQTFGYYDIFLVEPDKGHIVYSVYKELDYATSLKHGPYANTGIGRAFQAALTLQKGKIHLTDFDKYLPSYNNPASFMSTPIFHEGKVSGVLIFQMPIDDLNKIMTQDYQWRERGFGESGEIYLVGNNNTLRNESRFLIEDKEGYLKLLRKVGMQEVDEIELKGTSISLQPVDTKGVQDALAGKNDFAIFDDYRGVSVLSAYGPVKVGGMTWAIMSEIDEEEAFKPAATLFSKILYSSAIVTLILLLVSIVFAIFITNYLLKPLQGLSEQFTELNSGDADLNHRVSLSGIQEFDEVSTGFNKFMEEIKEIIDSVKLSTEMIKTSTVELSGITDESSQSADKQRIQAENITESIGQFNSTLQSVAENTVSASDYTQDCKVSANDNANRAKEAANNMSQLVTEVKQSSETLGQLKEEVSNIDNVLKVINNIADQTNLLALNAAIEAARAGENGRGFAVVADEVRQLATKTQESTVEIQEKIVRLTGVTNSAVNSMEKASGSANTGIELVNGVSEALDQLSHSIEELASINSTVASATEEQKVSCDNINSNISHVKDSSRALSDASERIDCAAVGLAEISASLQSLVDKFTV